MKWMTGLSQKMDLFNQDAAEILIPDDTSVIQPLINFMQNVELSELSDIVPKSTQTGSFSFKLTLENN